MTGPDLPRVTVAVPVKDRRERMLRCLDSLLAIDYPDYEVIVLDNESTDGTAEACRERARATAVPVRVETLPGSVGAIRNRAAHLATGEIIAFTDSDCMVDPGWVAAGVKALQARPEVGTVTGRTLPAEPITGAWPATIDVTGPTPRFESCNIFFRTAAFAATPGFDEVVGHFWEDTAAGFAMRRAGWDDAYEPGALVFHDVTYPGFRWHVKRAQRQANAAHVIGRYPEIRTDVLWGRVFLRPRSAKVLALAIGAGALAARRPLSAAALAAPYLAERGPTSARPQAMIEFGQRLAFDGANVIGCLRGSLRYRTLVI